MAQPHGAFALPPRARPRGSATRRGGAELAREWGAPGTVARSLRALAEVAPEDELQHLGEAVEMVDGSPARLEAAKSFAALGGALRRHRRPSDAREPLRRALELSVACGARGARGSRPRRALRRRRATAQSGAHRHRLAHGAGAPGCRARRRRCSEPEHRTGPLRDTEDGRSPPQQHVSQARCPIAPCAGGSPVRRAPTSLGGPSRVAPDARTQPRRGSCGDGGRDRRDPSAADAGGRVPHGLGERRSRSGTPVRRPARSPRRHRRADHPRRAAGLHRRRRRDTRNTGRGRSPPPSPSCW